jgi:predicted RNA methylase
MSQSKLSRSSKRQLGQFLTPEPLASSIVDYCDPIAPVLEPGCGEGSFLIPIIAHLLKKGYSLPDILGHMVWGVEIDPVAHAWCLQNIRDKFGSLPPHNIVLGDFFKTEFPTKFRYIIGNPPFGGSINPEYQDAVDKKYGSRHGIKIKKETYSFFITKCIDEHLLDDGCMAIICSDTFLTIPTMKGLRNHLMLSGKPVVSRLHWFSKETNYPMVFFRFYKQVNDLKQISIDHKPISYESIYKTPNLSWTISGEGADLFKEKIGDYMVCSSGMTTGKNEYFVREIVDGKINEPYDFSYFNDPITLKREIERARLNQISQKQQEKIKAQEDSGQCRRNVKITTRDVPIEITLPHPDYAYYNKSDNQIVYTHPKYAIFWRDNGDAVKTFKKNGNWYLHGIGGMPFFGREGLTWGLVSSRLKVRYLPPGYILDSGAPCAFLRDGVPRDEMYFIMGWLLTDHANRILKGIPQSHAEHTR